MFNLYTTSEPKRRTALLIGGNLVCKNLRAKGDLAEIDIVDMLIGCSPFSLACTDGKAGEMQSDALAVDMHNSFEAYLKAHSAEFLILDLHYVYKSLIVCGENYYTKFPDSNLENYGENAEFIDCKALPQEKRQQLIERYADTILRYFDKNKIVLIKTVKPEFYAQENRLREQDNQQFNDYLSECEQWFRERTSCEYVETLDFYFMVKKAGEMYYEQEAYEDLADNVCRFVMGKELRTRPFFHFSLDRYCRYYGNIYKRSFGAFLRTDQALENLVYSSEPWFVKKHYDLLIAANETQKKGYISLSLKLNRSMEGTSELRSILLAMRAVLMGSYVNPLIRYEVLFENRLVVRKLWKNLQEYAREHWTWIYPEQITERNYGYYFALMQMELTKNSRICRSAMRMMQKYQADDSIVLKPYAVDIWGSCVSRLAFQLDSIIGKSSAVIRSDMFQALPLFLDRPEATYDPEIFSDSDILDDRIVQAQLDGVICEELDQSGTQWVVVDLHTLTALSTYKYQEKIFCDNKGACAKKLDATKLALHKEFTLEQIFSELDKFAVYLNRRYGDRVILIKHKRMDHYLDFQGKLKTFSKKDRDNNAERKSVNDAYTDYLAKRCNCYYIDIVDQFLADEMGLLYLKTVHYEDEFYSEVCKLLRYIISEQPNQRHFTTYDSLTRVKRIAKLNAQNAESPVIQKLFQGGWLDELLLKLPAETVCQHADGLARLYDENYSDLKTAQKCFYCQEIIEILSKGAGK